MVVSRRRAGSGGLHARIVVISAGFASRSEAFPAIRKVLPERPRSETSLGRRCRGRTDRQIVRRGIDTRLRERRWRWRAAEKDVRQGRNDVTDVDPAVGVRIRGVLTTWRGEPEEDPVEREDRIRNVERALAVGVPTDENAFRWCIADISNAVVVEVFLTRGSESPGSCRRCHRHRHRRCRHRRH